MIKHLFIFCIILSLSIVSGIWLISDPGYILVVFHQWQIETSLVVFAVIVILSILVTTSGLKILHSILSLPTILNNLWQFWKTKRKQQRLNQGLEAYFQEQWPLALKHLKTKANPHAWTIDLLAASAAQQQGDLQERDMLIYEALSEKPSAKESIILFQAKLQIEKRQFEQAQASLEQIPLQSRFYSNLWQILQTHLDLHFGQYRKALERLMTYKKTLQSHHQYYDLYRQCLTHELNHALNHNQVIYAFELYKSSPLQLKINADILKLVLTHLENQPKLFKHVYHYLKKQAPTPLPPEFLIAMSNFPHPGLWLDWLERLSTQEHEAYYFYAKGKLNARQKIWGVAIKDLHQSIHIQENILAYAELSEIYLELQQPSQALEAMQKALKFKDLIG